MRFAVVLILLVQLVPSFSAAVGSCTSGFLKQQFTKTVKSKSITIVTVTDNAPMVSQTGKEPPVGFDIDLMTAIGTIWGIKFTYKFALFNDLISIVKADVNTISISNEFITAERMKDVDFAQFTKNGVSFLVKSTFTTNIEGYGSLCGLKVAVITGSAEAVSVAAQNKKCPANNKITITAAPAFTQGINLVKTGQVTVFPYDEILLAPAVAASKGQLKLSGPTIDIQTSGILFNKKNQPLGCALVNAINYLISTGDYEKLLEKYSFSFKDFGICPSKINLVGSTCTASCVPSAATCSTNLG